MSTTADALPDNADQDTFSTVPIPLRERQRDWFFVVMFAIFASTSFLSDTANTVGRPNPHSHNPMARFVYDHAGGIDPVLIANPRFVQLPSGSYRRCFSVCSTSYSSTHSCGAANGSGFRPSSMPG
jgi:hypothetical protein